MTNTYGMTPELFVPTYHELQAKDLLHSDQIYGQSTKPLESECVAVEPSFFAKRDSYELPSDIHPYPMPVTMPAQAQYDGFFHQSLPDLMSGGQSNQSSPISPATPSQETGFGSILQPAYGYTGPTFPVPPFSAQRPHKTQYEGVEHHVGPMQHFGYPVTNATFPYSPSLDGSALNQGPSVNTMAGHLQNQVPDHVPNHSPIGTWELQNSLHWGCQEGQNSVYRGEDQRPHQSPKCGKGKPILKTSGSRVLPPLICHCGVKFTGQYVKPGFRLPSPLQIC